MTAERTFVLIKPDGVQRGLVGEILRRFEDKGFKLVAAKQLQVTEALAQEYYAEHRGKAFFEPLVAYVTSGPAVAFILEGERAVFAARTLIGATDPGSAAPGTIRGDLGLDISRNLVHGADSLESAKREIALFFTTEEIQEYRRIDEDWLLGP